MNPPPERPAARAGLLLLLVSFGFLHAESSDVSHWMEDFANSESFAKLWSPYGFLAGGIDAKNPLGKPVSGKDSRPEWWQLVDGALRGQNFPEEKHGSGISRTVSGRDIRLCCRFKIPSGGMAAVGIRGHNPIVEKVFNVVSLHIRTDSVVAADNDVLHPKDSPEAAELKAKGVWNRRFYYAKTEKTVITPDVWHDLSVEVRGKELTVVVDAKPVLQYTTLCGDVPKTSIGFGVGGNGKTILATWYDDVTVTPL
jgi:hypothetical protein